jgi:hypothetical protein
LCVFIHLRLLVDWFQVLDELSHGGDLKVRKCLYDFLCKEDHEARFLVHLVRSAAGLKVRRRSGVANYLLLRVNALGQPHFYARLFLFVKRETCQLTEHFPLGLSFFTNPSLELRVGETVRRMRRKQAAIGALTIEEDKRLKVAFIKRELAAAGACEYSVFEIWVEQVRAQSATVVRRRESKAFSTWRCRRRKLRGLLMSSCLSPKRSRPSPPMWLGKMCAVMIAALGPWE